MLHVLHSKLFFMKYLIICISIIYVNIIFADPSTCIVPLDTSASAAEMLAECGTNTKGLDIPNGKDA